MTNMTKHHKFFDQQDDISRFMQNYDEVKKNYKTRPFLNKYEKLRLFRKISTNCSEQKLY